MTLRFKPTYVYKSIGLEVNNLSFILNSSDNQKSYEQRLLCSLYNYLIVEEVVKEQDYLRVLSITKEVGKIRPTFLAKLKLLGHTV
jgi:hypothetical protein